MELLTAERWMSLTTALLVVQSSVLKPYTHKWHKGSIYIYLCTQCSKHTLKRVYKLECGGESGSREGNWEGLDGGRGKKWFNYIFIKKLKIDWYFWCSDRKEKLKAECLTTYLEAVEEEYSWGVNSQYISNLGEVPDCPIHIYMYSFKIKKINPTSHS